MGQGSCFGGVFSRQVEKTYNLKKYRENDFVTSIFFFCREICEAGGSGRLVISGVDSPNESAPTCGDPGKANSSV